MENRITKNKTLGVLLMLMAFIGIATVIYRIAGYRFEYNAQFTPIDYGRFNVLSYFTIQSNLFACIYLITVSLAFFGNEKVKRFAFNPTVGAFVTLYVFIAGFTYNMGFPLHMTQHWTFDTPWHAFISFLQIYFHIVMVIVVLCLWWFPLSNKKLGAKTVLLSGIYPLVYSLVSMARGALFEPTYYPYPFYNPEFVWQAFMKDKPFNTAGAYGFIALLLVFGIGLFMLFCAIFVFIHNKRIKKSED
jgi:hypothetical protein